MKREPLLTKNEDQPVQINGARHERIMSIQQQLEALAQSEVRAVLHELATAAQHAQEIADGGNAYHPGLRDDMRRTAERIREFIGRTERLLKQ